MTSPLREHVAERAGGRCEYCQVPSQYDDAVFCLDHIIAKKHHGRMTLENLAFACYWCNSFKGDNLSGIDPLTGMVVRLFHPRNQSWEAHFKWEGAILTGLTDIGRATIDVLNINAPLRIELRTLLLSDGLYFSP
jgi:hypothetical protein